MDRKIIIAGAFIVAIAGASAVAFAGIGRSTTPADPVAADPNRPLQTLLSQVQSQGIPPSAILPLSPVAPGTEPAQFAQAPTPVANTIQPQAADAPTVTPGADSPVSPTPVTTATEQAAPQSKFVPTSGPMPRNQPQRTSIVRRVAAGAMCN